MPRQRPPPTWDGWGLRVSLTSPPTGAFCPTTAVAASLDTAPTLQTPPTGALGAAGELSITPTNTSEVLLAGDHAAVAGLQCASSLEPKNVPLPPGSCKRLCKRLGPSASGTTHKRLGTSKTGSPSPLASYKLGTQSTGLRHGRNRLQTYLHVWRV
ncbi:hypothetical protein MTO96_004199 [Rhipicephalus appendiculatus]